MWVSRWLLAWHCNMSGSCTSCWPQGHGTLMLSNLPPIASLYQLLYTSCSSPHLPLGAYTKRLAKSIAALLLWKCPTFDSMLCMQYKLGRNPQCEFQLLDQEVSSRHAILDWSIAERHWQLVSAWQELTLCRASTICDKDGR